MASFPVGLVQGPPRENPYQAAQQGAQFTMQQNSMAQALSNAAVQGDIAKTQLAEMQRQQQEQSSLSKAYLDAHGDMDQFFKNASAAGVRPTTLMPLQQQWDTHVLAASRNEDEQNKLAREHMDNLNGALLAQFSDGYDETGKPKFRGPSAQEWKPWLDQQRAAGKITSQQHDQLAGLHPDNAPPSADELQRYSASLMTGTQAIDQGMRLKQQQSQQAYQAAETQRANAEASRAQQQSADEARASASSVLSGTRDVGEYNRIYQILDPNIRKWFTDYSHEGGDDGVGWEDSAPITDEDKRDILGRGMTPQQQAQNSMTALQRVEAQARIDEQARHDREMESIGRSNSDKRRDFNTEPAGGLTPAQAQKQQIDDLVSRAISESADHGGASIDDAIRNVQKFYRDDPDFKRYRPQVLSQLYKLKQSGASATNAANKANQGSMFQINPDGSYSSQTPTPGGSQSKPAAKIFPRARLNDFAKANQISAPDAEAQLKAQGYTIQ